MARVEGGAVTILTDWPGLKNQIDTRSLNFRFEETDVSYEIFAIDGQYFYTAPIYKSGKAPDNQATYDTYRADFEANYKNRITDFNATDPIFLTNVDGYSVILKDGASPTANDGYGIAVIGIDGSNYRMLKMDSSGRPVMVGAGTAGSAAGGIVTVQGDPSGVPIPISGNITASNASVGTNDAAIPGFSNLIGGSDGTNLRSLRVFDVDSGGGQQWVLGVGLRKAAGGGSVELGTSSDPIRTDPTGTTTQPVSGTVTANQGGTWTVQPGNTANTTPWLITISQGGNAATVTGANALKVDGSAVTQPVSGTVTVTQSTAANLRAQLASETSTGSSIPSTALMIGGSDGSLLRALFVDSSGRPFVVGAAANGAAVAGNPVLVAGSDGTNARSIKTANDGTVRVDPTGTTTQPVSGTVAATQSGTWTVQPGNTANTTPWLITISQGGNSATVTASNALKVDGSAVTQPVSGTVTVTQATASNLRSQTSSESNTGSAVPTQASMVGGTDGTNLRAISVDSSGRQIVIGAAADGSPITGNPVLMAGQDGTNVQSIATDGYGRVQVSITGTSSTQVEGRAADGYTQVGNPVSIAGVDDDGYVQNLHVDSSGNLQVVSVSAVGTSTTRRISQNIATNVTIYNDYTVPVGQTLSVSSYYMGGGSAGRSTLAKHTSANVAFITNGDFENGTQVAAWAAVTGSFTAPTPDSNSTQFQTGAASMRWTYANSATALARRQTFTPVIDLSGYRYLRVKFFNDAATGTTRTISIIVASGTPTRTYSLSGTLGSAPFTANTWITLTADLDNPTTSTGTGFDLTAVSTITLQMQDAANKTGTVYWDTLRQEDQLDVRHRLYTSTGDTVSAPLNPVETFNASESVYLIARNIGNTTNEYTAIWSGTLV